MINLVGIPYDANSSFLRGAADAPPVIRDALNSPSSNMWSENGIDLNGKIDDRGDFAPASKATFASDIEDVVANHNEGRRTPIFLGGDHSISFPIVNALRKGVSQLSILHLDAHPDLYDDFEGNYYSHASPFARIMENGLASRLVQLGIRTMNGHQRLQAEKYSVEVHEMKDWRDDLQLKFSSPLYISFDMDALDPAFAPGVAHHEPGGLSTRQVVNILHRLEAPCIVGADIVEFNPGRDPSGITAMAAAKLIKEIAAVVIAVNSASRVAHL